MSSGEGATEPIDPGKRICEPVRDASSPVSDIITRTVEISLKPGDCITFVIEESEEDFIRRVLGNKEEQDLEC